MDCLLATPFRQAKTRHGTRRAGDQPIFRLQGDTAKKTKEEILWQKVFVFN